MVDLQKILATLHPVSRRFLFHPPGSYRDAYEREFPVFTFEAAWSKLSVLLGPDPSVSVCRGVTRECLELTPRSGQSGRLFYAIYRLGDDQYGIEETFSNLESEGSCPLVP